MLLSVSLVQADIILPLIELFKMSGNFLGRHEDVCTEKNKRLTEIKL